MTYCVGILVEEGLVLMADTRTNAGLDNISTFRKLHLFERPGELICALATAGNLSVTQSIMSHLREGMPDPETGEIRRLAEMDTMFKAAGLVGQAIRKVWETDGGALERHKASFDVSILLAARRRAGRHGCSCCTRPATSSRRRPTVRSCRSASTSTASRSSTAR